MGRAVDFARRGRVRARPSSKDLHVTMTPGQLATRPFTAADLSFGLWLTEQAGWNQTPDDWLRAYELEPDGAFVAQVDGHDAGVVTTCTFGTVAWIALLLVAPNMRSRGAGKLLLDTALDRLERLSIPSVRLDATPLGQPLYEQRGFVADFTMIRFAGRVTAANLREDRPSTEFSLGDMTDDLLAEALAIDRAVIGVDRAKLVERLYRLAPQAARILKTAGRTVGYVFARPGRTARHIGPCASLDPLAGRALLREAITRHDGENVFADIPADNSAACELARDAGLVEQRRLVRMTRGLSQPESPLAMWAGSGPEKG